MTSIVSAGYAPSEQYGSNQSKQGPWSDLYAVGATMYRSISGQTPIDAPTRSSAIVEDEPDPLISATIIGQERYTEGLLQLIDWMLAPVIKKRPQNVTEVLNRLEQNSEAAGRCSTEATEASEDVRSTVATVLVTESDQQQQLITHSTSSQNAAKPWPVITGIGVIVLAVIGISHKQTLQQLEITPTQLETVSEPSQPSLKNQIKGGLEETKQQVIQVQQKEQVKQEALVKQKVKTQKIIKALLTTATDDIEQLRLSSPKGNNAVENYVQVLRLDPDNQEAQQGFTAIVEKYLLLAKVAQEKQQYDRAIRLLYKAKNIQADNPKISQAKVVLKIAQEKKRLKITEENNRLKKIHKEEQWHPLDEISDFFKKIMFIK